MPISKAKRHVRMSRQRSIHLNRAQLGDLSEQSAPTVYATNEFFNQLNDGLRREAQRGANSLLFHIPSIKLGYARYNTEQVMQALVHAARRQDITSTVVHHPSDGSGDAWIRFAW